MLTLLRFEFQTKPMHSNRNGRQTHKTLRESGELQRLYISLNSFNPFINSIIFYLYFWQLCHIHSINQGSHWQVRAESDETSLSRNRDLWTPIHLGNYRFRHREFRLRHCSQVSFGDSVSLRMFIAFQDKPGRKDFSEDNPDAIGGIVTGLASAVCCSTTSGRIAVFPQWRFTSHKEALK